MLRLPMLNLCVTLWLLALLNAPFWRALWQAVGGWDGSRAGFLLSLPAFVLLLVWLVLETLTWGRAAKPVLAVVLIVSATAAYYMDAYAVVLDRTMIANIVQTHPAEALELTNVRMVAWVLVLGVAPLGLLARVRIARNPWHRQLLGKAVIVGLLMTGIVVVVAPFIQFYAPLLRNHRELRLALVPNNILAAVHSYARARTRAPGMLELAAFDARRIAPAAASGRRTLMVLVIGETARAANFGLNGYSRATTPQLGSDTEVINFSRVQSCGTSTAVSLPCMLLDVGRAGFSEALAMRRENLLDALRRAGYAVLWRDNNSGCKGLCDRVEREDLASARVSALCAEGECYDEVLLHGLQHKLDALESDAFIVLHMKGSHGPAYFRRYPAAFEHFRPACRTNELGRCERQAIVNAYDNTLRYTDHVLARTIDLLRRNGARFDASLVYVSDHGESLGERGVYLHGMPYAFAPDEQTHVPMLIWLSQQAQVRFGIEAACLRAKGHDTLTHDNLYHSILGLLDVQTHLYRAESDLFRSCRSHPQYARMTRASGRIVGTAPR